MERPAEIGHGQGGLGCQAPLHPEAPEGIAGQAGGSPCTGHALEQWLHLSAAYGSADNSALTLALLTERQLLFLHSYYVLVGKIKHCSTCFHKLNM